jgi:hypothetical protein
MIARLQVGGFEHQRDDVRLRDGLTRGDRQRAVLVGEFGKGWGTKASRAMALMHSSTRAFLMPRPFN